MRLGRDGIAGLVGLAITLLLLPQAFGLPRLPIVPTPLKLTVIGPAGTTPPAS